MITISELNITPVKPNQGLVGFCSFVINESIYIGGVAIYTRLGEEGIRLSWPEKKLKNDERIKLAHPINKDTSEMIEKEVEEQYNELFNE